MLFRLLHSPRTVTLELTPLCTWRDVHGDRHAWAEPSLTAVADGFVFEGAYRVAGPGWQSGGGWYHGVYAREEAARGLNATEDLWAAGRFSTEVEPGGTVEVTAAGAPFDGDLPSAGQLVRDARQRAADLGRQAKAADPVDRQLAVAADQFVIGTPTGPSVAAGYPWFGEWSRDLMTAFEGLFLTTNRHSEAREVLLRAGQTVSDGMLANTADTGTLEYNTADAALWFLHAVGRYVEATADMDIVVVLADKMDEILDRHLRGTRYGIVADPADGLLLQGEPGVALTWMDARVDGLPVTGRQGKAVEINALWVEGLAVTAELFARLGRSCDWGEAAERTTVSFRRRFPRPDNFGLYDVVDGTAGDDASVRPNQLLAVSLPHGPIMDPGPVEACRAALLTSIGLRSLALGTPGYQGRHRGGPPSGTAPTIRARSGLG